MKNTLLLGILCVLALPRIALSQEYSYTHYDIADGLAGSSAYCITQDSDGFIWIGTDAGVSRFDGAHFRNFTTKDGLPDLEVLQIFGDSKGRVWMAPFRNAVCYYYQGRIHNSQNDSTLRKMRLRENIQSFAEDAQGNILIQEKKALHILKADGSYIRMDSLDHQPVWHSEVASASIAGNFQVQVGPSVIEFSPERLVRKTRIGYWDDVPAYIAMNPSIVAYLGWPFAYTFYSFAGKRVITQPYDPKHHAHISFSILDDSLVYSNEALGTTEYNIHTGQTRQFLPGVRVSKVFRDRFGNVWFTSLGRGLFRLISNDTRLIRLPVGSREQSSVLSITRSRDELWVGGDRENIFRISLPGMSLHDGKFFNLFSSNRVLYIDTIGSDKMIAGTDYGLIEGTRGLRCITHFYTGVKSVVHLGDTALLVGCSWGAGTVHLPDFRIADTLWRERTTVVFCSKDTIYVGTLNGLYRSVHGGPPIDLGAQDPFLRRRISSIAESPDGTLWIASYDDAGIIGFKDGRQTISLTTRQGLTSDFCRTLSIHGNSLWVGTDKGLNRVRLDEPGYPVTQFTTRDGLASDMINTIYIDSSRVYVGTPEGLNYFNENKMTGESHCLLYLLSVANGDKDRIADTNHLVIPYSDRRVRFEFAAIDFRADGDVTYRYRLAGLDDKWTQTKENFLEYPNMPSGDYALELQAIDKFGVHSRLLSIPLEVTARLWERTWFILTAWLASLAVLWLLISFRIRRIRRRQQEKDRLLLEMNRLENTALKSQMNPHFIFNCLNSIQQSIFSGDTASANSYIAGLARLIRMTLHNSSRSFVHIDDEIDYLSSYLQLEKMRFKEKIDYEITIDPSIDRAAALIPPMLIQPYVENSLVHGLGPKKAGKGRIAIRIDKVGSRLIVTIEDNGVGRDAAAAAAQPAGHPSVGMALTKDRIDILNKLYERPFSITVADLKDDHDRPTGTRIVIDLPLFLEQTLYS
ncbi:MAG TPA: histidine kinase [Puia sp.]|nr:histidine kinase [Puia sp.]